MSLALYILALAALMLHAPAELLDPATRPYIIVLGLIGIWRYSWSALHFVRAQIYKRATFPALRRYADAVHADAVENAAMPDVYVLFTSYRIRAETTTNLLRGAVAEAVRYQGNVTLVASVVEIADQRLLKHIFYKLAPPERVRLVFVRAQSFGKRHSLAVGLNAIARQRPTEDAVVVLLDGDTVMTTGTLTRTVPFFLFMPNVGALTTDELPVVEGGFWIRNWFDLRFAQRQLLMCSMGLSRRLLTLTGRMSLFRASLATTPSFIDNLRDDSIDHWRLGRIPLLTGDDKSTWFWLLERRHDMLYVPDVSVLTLEHSPGGPFVVASTRLMLRWFGNMLRASSRAIALGPKRVGLFAWWCLIDQRISMWTPLLLPLSAAALALIAGPVVLYAYLVWVMSTRLVQALALLTVRDRVSGLYPLLIFYAQVYGALVKTWIFFHPYRQGWTRQPKAMPPGALELRRPQVLVSHYVHALALASCVTAVGFATGLLALPRLTDVAVVIARLF